MDASGQKADHVAAQNLPLDENRIKNHFRNNNRLLGESNEVVADKEPDEDSLKGTANKKNRNFYEEVYKEGDNAVDGVVAVNAQNSETTNNEEPSDLILPWYFSTGERYPKPAMRNKKTKKRVAKLLPSEDTTSDRITNQLMFVPPNYEQVKTENRNKVILLYNGLNQWNVKAGREVFLNNKCPVDTCVLTENRELAAKADMLLYKDHYMSSGSTRSMNQIYMIYYLECPYHTPNMPFSDIFNWTATYRRDSDVVAPYERWELFDPRVNQLELDRNYAMNKTKKVAWFVSNCNARNKRLQYANELGKHIQVSSLE